MKCGKPSVWPIFALILGLALTVEQGETHKLITSPYTYNDDVFPILRDRCGRCHVQDGVAPMSLMTYKDAFPWGESLRAELISGHMPPWHAQDGFVRFKNAPTLTAPEIDKILTWASGGNPEGNAQKFPPSVAPLRDWPLGKPDLVISLSPEVIVPADTSETTQEFTVGTQTTEPKWIRAVDLLPGTPSIVRDAIILVKSNSSVEAAVETIPNHVLAMWLPGEDPIATVEGTAFQLPAGAELIVRVHYKKTYQYEGKAMTDRSTVGLYFAPSPSKEIRRFDVASEPITSKGSAPLSFSRTVGEDLQALAFSPDRALSNVSLRVDTVSPAGVRTPVIRLAVRPNWTRRYWFDQPITLPRGTRIEVVAVLDGADRLLPPAGTPIPPQLVDGSPVRVLFDVVRTPGSGPIQ
jgi:hypothetical protein